MKAVFTAEEMQKADRFAQTSLGTPLSALIDRAAEALRRAVLSKEPHRTVLILCGKGNNGADGFALAEKLKNDGISALAIRIPEEADPEQLRKKISTTDLVVDCVFGTGFHGEIEGKTRLIFEAIRGTYTISADVPSGVECDTGRVAEGAVCANETVVLAAYKPFCFLYPAKRNAGILRLATDVLPQSALDALTPTLFALEEDVLDRIPCRDENANKGTFGKVRLVCGSSRTPGAAILCTKGALQSGVGLVRLAIPHSSRHLLAAHAAEAVFTTRFDRTPASAQVIGCGLGHITGACLRFYAKQNIPTVLDADALSYLALHRNILNQSNAPRILTPHPLEMARLTRQTVEEVERNRIEIARDYVKKNPCILVLKGHHTLIAMPDETVYINTTGNIGLAKGGSGDVLAGMIGGLLARGLDAMTATLVGVYVHGKAADDLAKTTSLSGILPSQIPAAAAKYLK